MIKPVLLLDVDGVLTGYLDRVITLLNELQSRRVFTEKDFPDWDFAKQIPSNLRTRFWERANASGHVTLFAPDPAAQKHVRRLQNSTEVVIVTSYLQGSPTWCHERDMWLALHFGIRPGSIIHTRAKQHVRGDIFVDDAVKNVVPWARKNPAGIALLWDRSYNQRVGDIDPTDANYRRITRWEEVHDAVYAATQYLRGRT